MQKLLIFLGSILFMVLSISNRLLYTVMDYGVPLLSVFIVTVIVGSLELSQNKLRSRRKGLLFFSFSNLHYRVDGFFFLALLPFLILYKCTNHLQVRFPCLKIDFHHILMNFVIFPKNFIIFQWIFYRLLPRHFFFKFLAGLTRFLFLFTVHSNACMGTSEIGFLTCSVP